MVVFLRSCHLLSPSPTHPPSLSVPACAAGRAQADLPRPQPAGRGCFGTSSLCSRKSATISRCAVTIAAAVSSLIPLDGGGPAWTLIKHEGQVYLRGWIGRMSPHRRLQQNGTDVSLWKYSGFVVPVTLPLDGLQVKAEEGDDTVSSMPSAFAWMGTLTGSRDDEKWQPQREERRPGIRAHAEARRNLRSIIAVCRQSPRDAGRTGDGPFADRGPEGCRSAAGGRHDSDWRSRPAAWHRYHAGRSSWAEVQAIRQEPIEDEETAAFRRWASCAGARPGRHPAGVWAG